MTGQPIPPMTPLAGRRFKRTPLRLAFMIVLPVAVICLATLILARGWSPSYERYPDQGITVDAASGAISWPGLAASSVDFVYIRATSKAGAVDPHFQVNLAGAHAAGLRHGVIHHFDPCRDGGAQATRFLTTVPRDNALLPPVVEVIEPACAAPPAAGPLLAALNTFLNQIEAHSGKPAILRLSPPVEARYDLSSSINRTLWLEGAFVSPDYATRPWVMWTASTWRQVSGIEGPIEWNVVRP
jgi:lysozyme